MFPPARLRYAVRALLVLAEGYPDALLSLRVVAAREGISEKYLEPVFAQLRRAGILTSIRGKAGGYRLKHAPEALTLYAIAGAIGHLPGGHSGRGAENESERAIWGELRSVIERHLEAVTLADARSLRDAGRMSGDYRI